MALVTSEPAAAGSSPAVTPVADLAVQLAHVRRGFGEKPALVDLSISAPTGTITVLLGPNGAGKTTAVRMITGALSPESGTVRVFGLDPRVDGEEVRRRCGVVSAKPALYDRLSGRDNLAYSADLYQVSHAGIAPAAERFGISAALDQQVGGYSTGMKTRLALARSVLHDPELLLYDEPTSGLDPESSVAVLELIHEMAGEGRTIVMCTHLLLEAEGLADQVVVLEAGHDVISGPPAELTRRYWPDTVVRIAARPAWRFARPAEPPGRARGRPRRRRSRVGASRRHRARARSGRRARGRGRAGDAGRTFRTDARGSVLRGAGDSIMTWFRVKTIARTDLRQLAQARDFWGPMVILGSVFFVFVPLVLLLAITHVGDIHAVQQVSQALDLLPQKAQDAIRGDTDAARTSYALAVYLFAPVAVVVPLTIATAVGATTIVGERERGTGEFLAHSPAALEDIYLGKLIASLLPGYATTVVGFGAVLPDRQPRGRSRRSAAGSSPPRRGGC